MKSINEISSLSKPNVGPSLDLIPCKEDNEKQMYKLAKVRSCQRKYINKVNENNRMMKIRIAYAQQYLANLKMESFATFASNTNDIRSQLAEQEKKLKGLLGEINLKRAMLRKLSKRYFESIKSLNEMIQNIEI
ncbi:hypothetical protein GJ496_008430 [Pomphorhynchus laevis]|nr:hypothetical protein GJ496_008430 [Pomphorhynchus laevis]